MSLALEQLRGLRVIDGLDDQHMSQLADIADFIDLPADTLIFRQGDPAEDVYLIVDGSVSLEVCSRGRGCRRILTIGEGELLGWSPVLEQARLTATARTLSATRAIKINGRQILTVCEHDSRFGYEFMKRAALALAKRLSATRLQLLDVFGEEMPLTNAGGEVTEVDQ